LLNEKNIGFNDFGYVIKPPQPSSAIYGALPFTGNQFLPLIQQHSGIFKYWSSGM